MITKERQVRWWRTRPPAETIDVICAFCQKPFVVTKCIARKRAKQNSKLCCSRSCAAQLGNRTSDSWKGNLALGRDMRVLLCNDGLTPFRWFVGRAKRRQVNGRCSKLPVTITPEYLREVWVAQNGRCAYTGWPIDLPSSCTGFDQSSARSASLDRIESLKGYIVGNVQFVARIVNFAKNEYSDSELIAMSKAIVKHRGI